MGAGTRAEMELLKVSLLKGKEREEREGRKENGVIL
jgi:hypothetical protein